MITGRRWRQLSPLGFLRYLWHWRYDSELCQWCGRIIEQVWWCESNALWRTLTSNEDGSGLVCIRCFDDIARRNALLLVWTPRLQSGVRYEREGS